MRDYVGFRDNLVQAMIRELRGPGSETNGIPADEEVITESPLQRYTVGVLYPQKATRRHEDEVDDSAANEASGKATEEEDYLDRRINTSNDYYPSAMGLSFYTKAECTGLKIRVRSSWYQRTSVDDCRVKLDARGSLQGGSLGQEDVLKGLLTCSDSYVGLSREITRDDLAAVRNALADDMMSGLVAELYGQFAFGWVRKPISETVALESTGDGATQAEVCDGLQIVWVRRPRPDGRVLNTVSLVNTHTVESGRSERNADLSFFQSEIMVETVPSGQFAEYELRTASNDAEDRSLDLLYRANKTYAFGHGCSVQWYADDAGSIERLQTQVIPVHEVPNVTFEVKGVPDEALWMRSYARFSTLSRSEQLSLLRTLADAYGEWLGGLEGQIRDVPMGLRDRARKHVNNGGRVHDRIVGGIDLLELDDQAYEAFQLANEAMLMQRAHSSMQQKKRYPEDDAPEWPDYEGLEPSAARWRPFQLAFLLMSLRSIHDGESRERDLVDLIWIPTGGGKTEAYLGLSAFVIFLRRLRYQDEGAGTAIIMRYTLRLLTSQQFQRASTLICACELLRQADPERFGFRPVSIGLWIGSGSTPNTTDAAFNALRKLISGRSRANPFQVLSCPWCGTHMVRREGHGEWGYDDATRPKRLAFYCPEETCAFYEGLPIDVVDETIYRDPPTLLFGTVDKFALLPWKKEMSSIFALDSESRSPELIIQDELHLISGPLGTIVGLYETAIDMFCSAKGVKPKIIASTATIRGAATQGAALYNREVAQFPAPGLRADDSFFVRDVPLEEKPGRLYAGVMSSGRTQTTTEIRVIAALLHYVKEIEASEHVRDRYWTLVSYFNSLRELGKAATMANDDIKDQMRRIAMRRRTEIRSYYEPEELTSRKQAGEIPEILEKLHCQYPDRDAIDILLATNMISVGVDVDRLSLMTVIGQPKTSSEFIQATSRVGRQYPGLVVTLYDGARSRDRSHYEQFHTYHQSLYRYVEPTSVTPFSGPARDRALHAVAIAVIRHLLGLSANGDISEFRRDQKGLDEALDELVRRVKDVSPREAGPAERELEHIIKVVDELSSTVDGLVYADWGRRARPKLLFPAGSDPNGGRFPTMQSMRSIDAECAVSVVEE